MALQMRHALRQKFLDQMCARAFQRGGMSRILPLLKYIHLNFGSWVFFFVHPAAAGSCITQSNNNLSPIPSILGTRG